MGKLDGRVALVTAGASGMGLASSVAFAREGAHVVVADLDGDAAASAVARIEGAGGSATPYGIDVSSVAQLEAMFAMVERDLGALHVLFNHAGIPGPKGFDVTEAEFDLAVGVNLKSQFFATKFARPLLEQSAGAASIIYTSSISGIIASPHSPVYGMTKGGTVSLMKAVAKALGPSGIRANVIAPGPIETPMLRVFTDSERSGLDDDAFAAQLKARADVNPLRRTGRPDDVSNAALFLASDDSAFVTGVVLPVDGGIVA